jgi:hypoxanthine phosphoribosyltransferase
MHGGEVHAESDGKGKGATFTFTLPIMALAEVEETTVESIDVNAQLLADRSKGSAAEDDLRRDLLSGLKVLAVDDQQDTRELIVVALEN